jgi:hypothetical protein
VGTGIAYGVLGRAVFGLHYSKWDAALPEWLTQSFVVMSLSFLFAVPLVVGFLDQVAPEPAGRRSSFPWLRAFFAPMVPVAMMVGIMALLAIEGSICIAMALPIFLVLGGIGGCVGLAVRKYTEGKTRASVISTMILLPYLTAPVEEHFHAPVEVREVDNVVRIRAPANVVWNEIKSVRAISPAELSFRFSHFIGLPRPIAATLSDDRVGGVRVATFERGLEFRETVTHWEPNRRLSFAIRAEPSPAAALDEHVAVGGPYFDVLDGTYELEAAPDGTTVLELRSRHRLSTRFNFYARWWTDFIMSDLQAAIMDVIRKRSEGVGSS